VLGAVAELERNIIRERVTAGLRRAKKEGKTLRRPRVLYGQCQGSSRSHARARKGESRRTM